MEGKGDEEEAATVVHPNDRLLFSSFLHFRIRNPGEFRLGAATARLAESNLVPILSVGRKVCL